MIDVVYWMRGTSHKDLVVLSANSVAKVYGTDAVTHMIHDRETEPKMLANVRAQLQYLMRVPFGSTVLFLDADTLITQRLPEFKEDLLVTWRDKVNGEESQITALMPYNYGVVMVHVCPRIIEAWMWMYQRICRMADSYQDWYGNQLALSELVGAPVKSGQKSGTSAIRWAYEGRSTPETISVLQLPCEQYNYTPESLEEDVSDKYVLHFKGERKDLMRQYAERMDLCTLTTLTPTWSFSNC